MDNYTEAMKSIANITKVFNELQAENKRLRKILDNIEEYAIGIDDDLIAKAIFYEIYSTRETLKEK